MKTVICVLGRSASGKTALAKEACARTGLRMVRSYTTRAPRASELKNPERCDHYFVDKAEFDRIMAEETPVAYTKINEFEYCATEAEFARADVYVIDPEGLERLRQWVGDRYRLITLYVSASRENAIKRLADRQESVEVQEARWAAEDEQFDRFEDNEAYDIRISNNGTFEEGVRCMQAVLLSFLPNPSSNTTKERKENIA